MFASVFALVSDHFVVTVLWAEEHLPEAWKAQASEIKEVMQAELFTTIASIHQATPETLRLIQIDEKPLPNAVILALQRPEGILSLSRTHHITSHHISTNPLSLQ